MCWVTKICINKKIMAIIISQPNVISWQKWDEYGNRQQCRALLSNLNRFKWLCRSPPNGNFTITGNEQYINSGWLLPKAYSRCILALHTL